MDEAESKETASSSGNIEEILRERDRLPELLQKRFKNEVIILFTDISGYTRYVENRGDISGRALIQKHNDIVMPPISI